MNPALPAFLLTLLAVVLLALDVFSTPFSEALYFLYTSAGGGVKFGIWGWCAESGDSCTRKSLGFHWDPQMIHGLTYLLVLYPIALALTILALLSLLPVLCYRGLRMYPFPMFSLLSLVACIFSLLAFVFAIALFETARERFHADGVGASYGPLPWLSLAATVALILTSLNSGCGTMWRGSRSPYLTYAEQAYPAYVV